MPELGLEHLLEQLVAIPSVMGDEMAKAKFLADYLSGWEPELQSVDEAPSTSGATPPVTAVQFCSVDTSTLYHPRRDGRHRTLHAVRVVILLASARQICKRVSRLRWKHSVLVPKAEGPVADRCRCC